jgi:hypothetical protein
MKKLATFSPYMGLLILCILMLLTGANFNGLFFADNPDRPIWFGVALRVFEGQKPHLDFISTMGPGIPWLYGLFLKVLGPQPESLHYGSAILVFFYGSGCLFLNASRWTLPVQVVFAAGLLIHMGYPTLNYNYLGYFFIFSAAIEAFTWDRPKNWRNSSALFGLLASFMFFAKYIFLIHGLGMLAVGFLWKRPSREWLKGFLLSFLLFTLFMFVWLEGNFSQMWSELSISRQIRGNLVLQEFLRPGFHLRFFHKYIWGFLLTIVPFILIWKKVLKLPIPWFFFIIPPYLFVLQNAVILSGSNWPHPYGKEWIAAIALIILSSQKSDNLKLRHFNNFIQACFVIWACVSLYQNYLKRSDTKDSITARFELKSCPEKMTYTCSVQEGLNIGEKLNLKSLAKPILLLTYEDPLTPYLRLPFLRHDLTHWSHSDSFSSTRYPDPEKLLAQVDYVLEPKFFASKFHEEAYLAKKALFQAVLERDFAPTPEHTSLKTWLIWQRVR